MKAIVHVDIKNFILTDEDFCDIGRYEMMDTTIHTRTVENFDPITEHCDEIYQIISRHTSYTKADVYCAIKDIVDSTYKGYFDVSLLDVETYFFLQNLYISSNDIKETMSKFADHCRSIDFRAALAGVARMPNHLIVDDCKVLASSLDLQMQQLYKIEPKEKEYGSYRDLEFGKKRRKF